MYIYITGETLIYLYIIYGLKSIKFNLISFFFATQSFLFHIFFYLTIGVDK